MVAALSSAWGTKVQGRPVVYVVDDDALVRDALAELIFAAGWQAETFASAEAFLLHPRGSGPSCLVVDVNLPGSDGLDLQSQVACQRNETPVIFVTAVSDVRTIVKAVKAGAVEFLSKPVSEKDLVWAIAQALDQSRNVLAAKSEMRALQERYLALSIREQQVLGLVVSGLLNKQIGFELGISEITVKAHRGRLMRKMGAGSLAALVKMAGVLGIAPEWKQERSERPARSAQIHAIAAYEDRRPQRPSLGRNEPAAHCDEHDDLSRWQPPGGARPPSSIPPLHVA
jgi:FixJ family two-component response regulator